MVSREELRTSQNDDDSLTFERTIILSPINFYRGKRSVEEFFVVVMYCWSHS